MVTERCLVNDFKGLLNATDNTYRSPTTLQLLTDGEVTLIPGPDRDRFSVIKFSRKF